MGLGQEQGYLQTVRTKAAFGSRHCLSSTGRKMLILVQSSRLNRSILVCFVLPSKPEWHLPRYASEIYDEENTQSSLCSESK